MKFTVKNVGYRTHVLDRDIHAGSSVDYDENLMGRLYPAFCIAMQPMQKGLIDGAMGTPEIPVKSWPAPEELQVFLVQDDGARIQLDAKELKRCFE